MDFSGDGHLDLAVVYLNEDNSGGVTILPGNGDGTFQPEPGTGNAVGNSPDAIVAGDFTGNGRTDLAVANEGDNTISVLLSNGDGTFQPQVTYAVGTYPYAIVAGDFNGDGHLDLAVLNLGNYPNDGTVSILMGNGDGTFQPQVTYAAGYQPDAIVAGDFTGNGILDLAVANAGLSPNFAGTVSVLLGNGDGTFQPQVTYAAGIHPTAIVAGDFTGNGKLDLAVSDAGSYAANNSLIPGTSGISVLLGNGDGTFQTQVFLTPWSRGCKGRWWLGTSTTTATSTWPSPTRSATAYLCSWATATGLSITRSPTRSVRPQHPSWRGTSPATGSSTWPSPT